MDPTQPISQQALADAIGIAPAELKKLRDAWLEPGVDWQAGAPVVYAPSGIKKIRDLLELETLLGGVDAGTGAPQPAPEKKPATERVALTVIRPARGNPIFVHCRTATGELVRLRVKSNVHFTAGMTVPTCVASASSPGLYEYEGRLPRRKGRF